MATLHNKPKVMRTIINATMWRLWNDPDVQMALRLGLAQHINGMEPTEAVLALESADVDDVAAWLARR